MRGPGRAPYNPGQIPVASRAQAAFPRLRWLLPAVIALLCARDAREPVAEPLTRLRDVRTFARLEDREVRDVDVQGVVTCFDSERGILYLSDATGPAAIAIGDEVEPVLAGGLVSVRGSLDPGSSTPRLRNSRLTVLMPPSLDLMPEPRPVSAATLPSRQLAAEWLEVRGVLRSAVRRGGILHLDLQDGGHRFRADVFMGTSTVTSWYPDTRLLLRGVSPALVTTGTARDLPQLVVPATDYLRIEEDAPIEPFAASPLPLGQLSEMRPESLPERRVRVRGSVLRATGPRGLVLSAEGRELTVATEERTAVGMGETVDVVGFATPGEKGVFLEHALVRSGHDVGTSAVAPALPPMRTAADVRRLSRQEAREGRPIKLDAVVTFNDPEMRLLFVQDGTAGIYVESFRHVHRVRAGDRVEIEGVSGPGAFLPIVSQPRVRVVGRAPLPPARPMRPQDLRSGEVDSQWIEVEGVVRAVTPHRRFTAIRMAQDGVRLQVEMPSTADPGLATRLVNARVRVRAVCRSVLTVKGQWADIVLNSPGPEELVVVTPPAADPFALPVSPVNALLRFVAGQSWEHRVRVQGTVTFSEPGDLYLDDGSGGLRVRTSGGVPPAVGDEVDAVGFASASDYSPVLQDAEVRVRGRKDVAVPVVVTPEDALRGRCDGELVRMEARLLEHVRGKEGGQLSLRAGPYLFTALLAGPAPSLDALRPGSGLRLTGVCRVSADEQRVPQSFQLLLRSPSDVEVPDPAPWWTPRHAAWVLAAMAGAVALSLAWVVTLRRHAAAQTRIIWQEVKRETELQERQRMARELHDTLEQNLTGISLCLEAASLTLDQSPKMAEQHLGRALLHVDRSIEEVHRSVWALREESLEAHGLAASLDEIGQQLAGCSPTPIAVSTHVEGQPRPFSLSVENNLLHIGQEALTNAVKHGKATRIVLTLSYADQTLRLQVGDDGRGFDARAPTAPGRLGLVGMRERAREIGGRMEVRSAVGRGTEVEVHVPFEAMTLSGTG
jgi:signal transduction histidine kinase